MLKKLIRRNYSSLNTIKVFSENLKENYKNLSSISSKLKISPVLKSNAYGHGLIEVARILDPLSPPFFCVDSLYEAYELLKIRIKTHVLVMGYVDPRSLMTKRLTFSFAVYDLEQLKQIKTYQPHAGLHIFVDTGMHREGVKMEDLEDFIDELKSIGMANIEGLMSHLACAERESNPLTMAQLKNFEKAVQIFKKNGINPKWVHTAATAGVLNQRILRKYDILPARGRAGFPFGKPDDFPLPASSSPMERRGFRRHMNKIGNVARVGLGIYITKPALRLTSKIAQIKSLKKGEAVGYDFTFKARKNMGIGILPIGYNDGVDRRLSNIGWVLVDGQKCRIIGRVSMNITTIDLSRVHKPYVGQEVVVFSENSKDLNSIENAAIICKTIPYELLVHLSPTIKRVLV